MKLIQNLIRIDLSSLHPFLKIAKYGRRWAIKTISLEGVIWVDVQISQGNFATRNETKNKKKSENDYMIMPENFNKKMEQKGGP